MKQKKSLLIFVLVFAGLIGGAYLLYNHLSSSMEYDMLAGQNMSENTEKGTVSESSGKDEETADDAEEPEQGQNTEEAVAAPDFTVTDAQGNEVSLTDFRGRPVVLNFWASWCGPCKSEMPAFDEAFASYGEEIHFLMVNLTDGYRETAEAAQSFIEDQGYSFPVYFDTESSAAIAYGVYSIPATYFIDAEGNAVAQANGAIDAETLQLGIDMIYKP